MKIMAGEFVLGRDIDEAVRRSGAPALRRYRFSYDMLGEAALTNSAADRYEQAYAHAIETLGRGAGPETDSAEQPAFQSNCLPFAPVLNRTSQHAPSVN